MGELDEEVLFESRSGETFVLGASSWKIVGITPSQVLVVPAPGQPGEIAAWHGDPLSRPPEGIADSLAGSTALRLQPLA